MRFFLFVFFPILILCYFPHQENSFAKTVSDSDTLTATDSILQFWLKKVGVDDDKPIFKTFYFWTTKEELDSVEQEHTLLRSVSLPDRYFQFNYYYHKELENKKWDKNPIADYFREGMFGRMRAAWPCYWSQINNDTLYFKPGTQLVRVDLEDSSLIAVFCPDAKIAWQIFDLNGNLLLENEIVKRKNQIAVLYFSEHIIEKFKNNYQYGPKTIKLNFYERTFFLCNEKMIKHWDHGVPGLQKQILDDLKYLLLLDAYIASDISKTLGPGKNGKNVAQCWIGKTTDFSIAQFYFRTQQFADSEKPEAFPFAIDQIIGTLRYRWPKQVHPMERFPSREMK